MHHNLDIRKVNKFWIRLNNSWPIFYLAITTILIALSFSHWAYDDPYITYRYASNLTNGNGFVYNPGERILSTTTPLFTLILTIFMALGFDPHTIAIILGAFSLGLGALFIWELGQALSSRIVGWVGLLLYPNFPLLLTTLGSETPIYLAFCLGAFASNSRRNHQLTAVFAALSILTRPDGLLVPVIISAQYLLSRKSPIFPWKAISVFLGITIPWIIFAWTYFKSPLPVTLYAKQSQGTLTISQSFSAGFLSLLENYSNKWYWQVKAAIAVLGVGSAFRFYRQWTHLLIWPLLYYFSYSFLGVSSYFWYYAPLVPGFLISVGLGLHALSEICKALNTSQKWTGNILPIMIICIFWLTQSQSFYLTSQRQDPRIQIYRETGIWLQQNTSTDSTVGALEIGILGYYSQRNIIDFAGLLQPNTAQRLIGSRDYESGAIFAVESYKPDYIVIHQDLFPKLEEKLQILDCSQVHKLKGVNYNYSRNIVIYYCQYPP